ncbi:hypothetical protein PGIGA_G00145440 [Pangasianodon gigas]|uniref:Uncharacterized protein n=1 Tax=Pangasianodon gigas TaxID=30993 RepID=A0ACC5XMR3_PANGG|nr:hypothetical protein [Pangasianodon gigas]
MQYFYTGVTPGINFPEFTLVGQVDGQQIVFYDSNIRKMTPKTEWIQKINADDPDYWSRETQSAQRQQENFKVNVATAMQRFNQTKVTHSLQYISTGVTPGINFPEFTAVGQVDGEQFDYYDSNIRKMIPKTEWIQKHEGEDYWSRETQTLQGEQESFKVDMATLMQRFNQTTGVHATQVMYGCELDDDGTTRGYRQDGYDGEDFISFDLKTLTWIAPTPQAVITKHKWDNNPGTTVGLKNYLENICIEWLKKYVSYGRETLERKVTVTSPVNLLIVVIYRPPGPLGAFLEEMDMLLSLFSTHTPLTVLGDFNLPADKLQSSCLLPLLHSFSLTFNSCPPTHKGGNTLDLVFSCPFPTSDIYATPLHISDHLLVSFTITLPILPKTTSHLYFSPTHKNLHSISPSSLASCTLSSLPVPDSFSSLPLELATDTFLSSLSSSLELLGPLSSKPRKISSPAPWLSDVLRSNRRELRTAERKWKKSQLDTDLVSYRALLSKFSSEVTSAKIAFYKEKLESSAQDPLFFLKPLNELSIISCLAISHRATSKIPISLASNRHTPQRLPFWPSLRSYMPLDQPNCLQFSSSLTFQQHLTR